MTVVGPVRWIVAKLSGRVTSVDPCLLKVTVLFWMFTLHCIPKNLAYITTEKYPM